jgi:hypothetical protein
VKFAIIARLSLAIAALLVTATFLAIAALLVVIPILLGCFHNLSNPTQTISSAPTYHML